MSNDDYIELEELVIDLLISKGYQIHKGEDEHFPQYGQNAWWFTWSTDGCGIECGDTFANEVGAWRDAVAHYFINTEIKVYTHDDLPG